jgi:hypothetical protein
MIANLSDDDLRRLRTDTENNFVERKPIRDKDGWLRTAVAFANSTSVDAPAFLLIGIRDDGAYENLPSDHNWEKLQKTVTTELTRAYPPLYFVQRVIQDPDGRSLLVVIISGSPERPHFAGKSYLRVGPETRQASEVQFNAMIAERNSAAYTVMKWIGKRITVAAFVHGTLNPKPCTLVACNQHYFTVEWSASQSSYPLNRAEISYNHNLDCLQLEVRDLP